MIYVYVAIGIVALLLLFLGVLYFVYRSTFFSPHKGQDNDYSLTSKTLHFTSKENVFPMIDALRSVPFEGVYIKSFDKKDLFARVYVNEKSNKVAIMFHGYRGTPYRDFSGGAKEMIDLGHNVILVDQRAHGHSGGHSITFGVKEKKDAKSWIEYAKSRFGNDINIILVGISMGGATVLLASDLLSENDKVIADCPYTTPKEIICETLKTTLHMSPKFFYPIANLSSIIFGRANLSKDDANIHVKNSKAKFMIIHGDLDSIVPYKFSRRVYEDNKDKVRYELFKGAEHGISYIVDKSRYQRIVKEFIEE